MTVYIYDKMNPAIKTEFNDVVTVDVRQVNAEISVVDIKFKDQKFTAREFDPSRYAVHLDEEIAKDLHRN